MENNNDFLISYQKLTRYQNDGAAAVVKKEGYTCLLFINQGMPEQSEEMVRELRKEIDKIPLEELRGLLFEKEKEEEVDEEMKGMLSFDTLDPPSAMYMSVKEESVSHNPINESFWNLTLQKIFIRTLITLLSIINLRCSRPNKFLQILKN